MALFWTPWPFCNFLTMIKLQICFIEFTKIYDFIIAHSFYVIKLWKSCSFVHYNKHLTSLRYPMRIIMIHTWKPLRCALIYWGHVYFQQQMPPLDLTLPLLGLFGCAVLVEGGPGSSLLLLGHSVLNWSLCGSFLWFLVKQK